MHIVLRILQKNSRMGKKVKKVLILKVAWIWSTVIIFLLFLPYLCYDKVVSGLSTWGCEFHVEESGSGSATPLAVLQLCKYWCQTYPRHFLDMFASTILSISDKGDSTISQTACSGVPLPWSELFLLSNQCFICCRFNSAFLLLYLMRQIYQCIIIIWK